MPGYRPWHCKAWPVSSESAIAVEGLVKRYGRLTALDGVSFSVPRGSIFGFLGPNGAGKTTTLRILATLLQSTGGHAWVAGEDVTRHPRQGPKTHWVHARFLRSVRRPDGAGVPGILRPGPRSTQNQVAEDHRRPVGIGGPGETNGTSSSRLCLGV